jgi:hypothetical protein
MATAVLTYEAQTPWPSSVSCRQNPRHSVLIPRPSTWVALQGSPFSRSIVFTTPLPHWPVYGLHRSPARQSESLVHSVQQSVVSGCR